MKKRAIKILEILFFLIINTSYYWEVQLGLFAMPAFLVVFLLFLALGAVLVAQLWLAAGEKLINRQRLYDIGILAAVLGLTVYKPFGIIDFDSLQGKNILVAEGNGTICSSTFRLKENFKFTERRTCLESQRQKVCTHLHRIQFFSIR